MEFKRILLVEDDPNDVELTLTALSAHNLANEVQVVNDGAEALDYLFRRGTWEKRSGEDPVVVLLDIKMPKVNGIEVLRQLKTDANRNKLPVVMLTSSREEPDLAECYRLGVNAFVVKPVDFQSFMEAVKTIGIFWGLINEPPLGTGGPK